MTDWYGIAKDFAGPLATTLAATTAAIITYRFAKIQAGIAQGQARTAEAAKEIAHSQRNIAYDKLKHDLFGKRYDLYVTARSLIECVSKKGYDFEIDPEVAEMRLKLREAPFFYPPKEAAIFADIDRLAGEHEGARVLLSMQNLSAADKNGAGTKAGRALMGLVGIYENFTKLMEKELGFAQLTNPNVEESVILK